MARQRRERLVDEQFGLWTRDQHASAHVEGAPVELLHPADVRDRLAQGTSQDQRRELLLVVRAEGFVAAGQPGGAVPREHVAHQQLGVEGGLVGRNAGADKRSARGVDQVANARHGRPRYFFAGSASGGAPLVVTSFKRSDWKNVVTASSISASSPFSTVGSWWVVKFTRWSVMRLCGKL